MKSTDIAGAEPEEATVVVTNTSTKPNKVVRNDVTLVKVTDDSDAAGIAFQAELLKRL